MKRLAALLCLTLTPMALAAEHYQGTIVATTTKNNRDTATPFSLANVSIVLIQCDAAAYVATGSTSSTTVTTANGRKVAADEAVYLDIRNGGKVVAALAVSGTVNCKVFAVY